MPSITQLRYVLMVGATGHFGRAADRLNISQPTLSAQIRKAEQALDVTLFNRQERPVVLTEKGAALIQHIEAVVDAHDHLLQTAGGTAGVPAGPFSLGIIPTLAPYLLPWFLQTFAKQHPLVELSIYERPTDELLAEIAERRLDAAVLATPLGEPSIHERVLFYDPFYLYAHKDEALLNELEVDVAHLDARKLWLLEDGHCFRAQVINFCGARERTHLGSVRFAGGSFETIRHLIDASEGYTLVPETYARTLSRATRLRSIRAFAARTPTREVSLVHHHASYKEDVLDALEANILAHTPKPLLAAEPNEEDVLPITAA